MERHGNIEIESVQRATIMCIGGALSTTPIEAMNALLDLLPIDIMGLLAASTAVGLQKASERLLRRFCLSEHTDYCISFTDLMTDFKVVIPDINFWGRIILSNTDWIHFYTHCSDLDNRFGGGIYSKDLGICKSYRLPDHCCLFPVELVAINEAVIFPARIIVSIFFSDSQAATRALKSVIVKSKTIENFRRSLDMIAKQLSLNLVWLSGQSSIMEEFVHTALHL